MTLYNVKPEFQKLLRPLVVRLHGLGITANQVTLLAMLGSVFVGGMLVAFPEPLFFVSLPVFLFLRMAMNAIDGMLAREFNQQSTLGALLNEVGDVVSDAALYLAFAFLTGISSWLVVLVVLLALLTEFCGIVAQTLTNARSYRGPLGKSDRAFLFGALGLFIALWPQSIVFANSVFGVAALLLIWTCINRCYSTLGSKNA